MFRKHFLCTAVGASMSFLAPVGANAALLTPDTSGVLQSGATELFFDPVFGLVGSGPGVTSFDADLEPAGGLGGLGGAFFTSYLGSDYHGVISDVGFNILATVDGGDTIQFVVDLDDAPFSDGALVTFVGEFGVNNVMPFGSGFFDADAQYTLAPLISSQVPLPAGFPLILGGLAVLAFVGRHKGK